MLMMLTTVSQIIMHSMEYSHGIVAIPSLQRVFGRTKPKSSITSMNRKVSTPITMACQRQHIHGRHGEHLFAHECWRVPINSRHPNVR
jgi:hypothetical protein